MAFVYQAQRLFHQQSGSGLSPQYYNPSILGKVKQSPAPFSSSQMRQAKVKEVTPGPGNYNLQKSIVQPIVQTVSNKNGIIVKINAHGLSSFKNQVQRFRELKSQTPGPGSYNSNYKHAKGKPMHRRRGMSTFTSDRKRVACIPQRVINLFKENPVFDQKQLKSRIGPGTYQSNLKQQAARKASAWSMDKRKRFQEDQSQPVGPGKYFQQAPLRKQSDYRNNPSSSFISQTCRTHFDTHFYKTNLDFKAKIRQKIKFKDSMPGPGQYQVVNKQFDSNLYTYQFFGSTVERFRPNDQRTYSAAPGSYNIPPAIINKSKYKGPQFFNSGSAKTPTFLGNLKQDQCQLGPGSYLYQKSSFEPKKKRGKQAESFGIKDPRFKKSVYEIQIPGPGYYKNQNQPKIAATSSNFKSSTVRGCNRPTAQNQITKASDTFYQVHNYQIADKLNKKKQFLQNLKKIDVQKPAFDSSCYRFPHYQQIHQQNRSQAPSKQKHQSFSKHSSSRLNNSFTSFAGSKNVVFSKSDRFKDLSYRAPDVGSYEPVIIGRKSFNIKFNR